VSPAPARLGRTGLLLLVGIALGWGLNWPIMKHVLTRLPPLSFRSFCLVAGGLGVLLLARRARQPITIPAHWRRSFAWITATNILGWNVFAIYGVWLLPSGRAALLGYTMPIWSILLAAWLLDERLDRRKLAALTIGMCGTGALIGADFAAMARAPVGVLCMLTAALSWAVGVILIKRAPLPVPTATLTGWSMLAAGLPMWLVALFIEHIDWSRADGFAVFGVLYNIGIAYMFCYWAWNRIVLMVPVAVSSLASLVTPLVGVLGGMIFLGERPGALEWLGAGLVLGAQAVMAWPKRRSADG
jgi:drug/metabolite transporter (DMT)-like permease